MTEPTDSLPKFTGSPPGIERAKTIVKELADAAQSAAMSVVDEQTGRATSQVRSLAEALHAAGRSFEQSRNPAAAEFAHSAARRVEDFIAEIRGRQWTQIAADLDSMARHRPVRFIAGAVALGFFAGRLFTASPPRATPADRGGASSSDGAVTAALASASGESGARAFPSKAREAP